MLIRTHYSRAVIASLVTLGLLGSPARVCAQEDSRDPQEAESEPKRAEDKPADKQASDKKASGKKASDKKASDKKASDKKAGDDGSEDAEDGEAKPEQPSLADSLTGMAKAEYAAGRILYEDGDYAGALLKFERAYELSQDARLLWNMAAAEKNLRHYASSLELVNRYLAAAGDTLAEEDRARAVALTDTVKGFVATLTITVDQPGAEVSVNGKSVGQSPLPAALRVDMGDTAIKVVKHDYEPFETITKLPGGEEVSVEVTLKPVVKEGKLRVVASHGDVIHVDGKRVGSGSWSGDLTAGVHTVEVTGEGKRPYRGDVVIQAGQSSMTNVSLEPIVKSSAPPEKDSGGVPMWAWIGGGVLLAGAGATVAYFALSGGETERKGVAGTAEPGLVPLRF